jgi:hypothetical protein
MKARTAGRSPQQAAGGSGSRGDSGKPKKAPAAETEGRRVEQVAVRLEGELLELVDAEVEKRQGERPWDKITRVDILREALWRMLKAPTK